MADTELNKNTPQKNESLLEQYRRMAPDDKRVIQQFCWEVIFGLVMAVIAVSIIKTESWLSSALLFIVVWIFSFCVAMYKDAEENEKEDKEKRKTRRKSRSRSRSDSDDDRLPTGWNGTDEIMVTGLKHGGREKFIREHHQEIDSDNVIDLVREPDNRYDRNAVGCLWKGTHIGYIPSGSAQFLAPALDNGMRITATCDVWTSPDGEALRVYLKFSGKTDKDWRMLERVIKQISDYSE